MTACCYILTVYICIYSSLYNLLFVVVVPLFVPCVLGRETNAPKRCSCCCCYKTQVLSAVNFVSFSAGAPQIEGGGGAERAFSARCRVSQNVPSVAAAFFFFMPIFFFVLFLSTFSSIKSYE